MQVEIITIGNEILSGRTVDTNFAHLARALEESSVSVVWHTTVGDHVDRIGDALRAAVKRADAIVVTGGLGPTPDDITRKAVATALGRPLRLDDRVLASIRERATKRGRTLPPSVEGQALLPVGAEAWPNPVGSAPGILLLHDETPIILLPGVPGEMRALSEKYVVPFLRERSGRHIKTFTLRTAGVFESKLHEKIGTLPHNWPSTTFAYLPGYTGVDLRVTVSGTDQARVAEVAGQAHAELMDLVGAVVYGEGGATMEETVGGVLLEKGWFMTAAESCTGGLLMKRMTDTPGSSRYVDRGWVTYTNEAKQQMLGVKAETLAAHGAVSAATAEEMVRGALTHSGAQAGASITGIAGPDGGTDEKPVGTVFIAVASPDGTAVRRFRFHGARDVVRERSAQTALDMLRRHLLGLPLDPRLD